jgi:hypothetical protein
LRLRLIRIKQYGVFKKGNTDFTSPTTPTVLITIPFERHSIIITALTQYKNRNKIVIH